MVKKQRHKNIEYLGTKMHLGKKWYGLRIGGNAYGFESMASRARYAKAMRRLMYGRSKGFTAMDVQHNLLFQV